MAAKTLTQRCDASASGIREALLKLPQGSTRISRKVSTLLDQVGRRPSVAEVLLELEAALLHQHVYCMPRLSKPGLKANRFVSFSLQALTEPAPRYSAEKYLRGLVKSLIGHCPPFEGLTLDKSRYDFPGRLLQADLLCYETVRNRRHWVVIELKKDKDPGVAVQVARYVEAVKSQKHIDDSRVRAIIITGEGDAEAYRQLTARAAYRVDWYTYSITFPQFSPDVRISPLVHGA